MSSIPFKRHLEFDYGKVDQVTPLVRRVIAHNPGPFTGHGTGTYIIGRGNVAVIDPGPLDEDHLRALRAALTDETITHIPITHTHKDHSPAAEPLKQETGAKTYGYGPHGGAKRPSGIQVEEGGDRDFIPDVEIRHGDLIEGDGWTLECVHTPGHTSNHMCFALPQEKILFTGDHVMGWSTSVISPPDGNMQDYFSSLRLLLERDDEIYWPTHGPEITKPKPYVRAFLTHRRQREAQISKCLERGIDNIPEMVADMYKSVDKKLHPAASMSVLAHLIHMIDTNRAYCDGPATLDSVFTLEG